VNSRIPEEEEEETDKQTKYRKIYYRKKGSVKLNEL